MTHIQHSWKVNNSNGKIKRLYRNQWLDRRPRLLIVGFGDIGQRLAAYLGAKSCLTTASRKKVGMLPSHIQHKIVDLDQNTRKIKLPMQSYFGTIYLAPPSQEGDLTDHRIKRFLAYAHNLTRPLIYISTTGVYGDQAGKWIDETCVIQPQTRRAKRRVSAEIQVRRWGKKSGRRISILRAPGIYGHNRLPIKRLLDKTPTLVADADVYTNHIHADDLARLSWYALIHGKAQRTYNACDQTCLKMGDYFDLIADNLGIERPTRHTPDVLQKLLSEVQYSFMQESRRISSERLKELKYTLRYPHINCWIEEACQHYKTNN